MPMITTISATHSVTKPRTNTPFAARILFVFVLAVCGLSAFSATAHAQGSLQLGSISVSQLSWQCDPTGGWYYYQNGQTNTYMKCQNAVINCPNTQSMSLAFGEINPADIGLVPHAIGTIVILGGDGGILPGNFGIR